MAYETISRLDLEIKLARHFLWLHDQYGGEQATLYNLFISEFNFEDVDLSSSVIKNCEFENCNFFHTDLRNAECVGTKFHHCDMLGINGEEGSFYGATFEDCILDGSSFIHSNLATAKFKKCDVKDVDIQASCVVGTEWIATNTKTVNMDDTVDAYEEWDGDLDSIDIMQM